MFHHEKNGNVFESFICDVNYDEIISTIFIERATIYTIMLNLPMNWARNETVILAITK